MNYDFLILCIHCTYIPVDVFSCFPVHIPIPVQWNQPVEVGALWGSYTNLGVKASQHLLSVLLQIVLAMCKEALLLPPDCTERGREGMREGEWSKEEGDEINKHTQTAYRQYEVLQWRQLFLHLVNPSLKCLHMFATKWGQGWSVGWIHNTCTNMIIAQFHSFARVCIKSMSKKSVVGQFFSRIPNLVSVALLLGVAMCEPMSCSTHCIWGGGGGGERGGGGGRIGRGGGGGAVARASWNTRCWDEWYLL